MPPRPERVERALLRSATTAAASSIAQRARDAGGGDLALRVADHGRRLDAVRSARAPPARPSRPRGRAAPRRSAPASRRARCRSAASRRGARAPRRTRPSGRRTPVRCRAARRPCRPTANPWPGKTIDDLAGRRGRGAAHQPGGRSAGGQRVQGVGGRSTTARWSCSVRVVSSEAATRAGSETGQSRSRAACSRSASPLLADSTQGTISGSAGLGDRLRLGGLLQDDVGVGAAQAERRHPGPARTAGPGPRHRRADQLDRARRPSRRATTARPRGWSAAARPAGGPGPS